MGYTSVEKRNSAGATIPAKPVSVGGYTPVSSRTTTQPISSSQENGSVGGYIPVDKRPKGFVPLQTVQTPAPVVDTPKGPGLGTKIQSAVAESINTPANKTTMPELRADFKTLPLEEKKKVQEQYTKDLEDWRKKNDFGSNLPSAIMESLPFGLGAVFKQIHEEENAVKENPDYAPFSPLANFDNKDLIKNLPGATVEAAKGFVKAPISGAVNIYDTVANKKTKFNIPGLGEVSSAQYRTAERVANGENPVQVALEEGSTAILDTLFFISLAAKPFQGRPTTTAKVEMPSKFYEKVPGASQSLMPKSFRLYEPKTSARPLSPEFISQAQSQGINLGPRFNPNLPTYFKMTFKPKNGGTFVGEVVQIKPSYAKMLTNLFGKKADPGYAYTAKDLGQSGRDLDRAIESGDMPVQKVYKDKSGHLTPEYAKHVVSDLAGKLDQYQPGLGDTFQKSVKLNNPTPTNLDAQALVVLNNAVTGNTGNVPTVISPPLGLSPAQISATPEAQLEILHTKEIKTDDIENASKNPIIENVIPPTTTTPQERANALMDIPNAPAKVSVPGIGDVPIAGTVDSKTGAITFEGREAEAKKFSTPEEFIGSLRVDDPLLDGKSYSELVKFHRQVNGVTEDFIAKPNAEVVKKLEIELQNAYKKYPEAEDTLSQILTELELAQPGQRIFLEHDGTRDSNVIGVASTFPAWIPEGLRTTKSLETLRGIIKDISTITYPTRSNAVGRRLLVDEMLNVLDDRLGVNTGAIRRDILQQYGKTQEVNSQRAGGSEQPAGRGEATAKRGELETQKKTEKEEKIARLKQEIIDGEDFGGKLSEKDIAERKTELVSLEGKPTKKLKKEVKKPVDKFANPKATSDTHDIQEIRNSINEGKTLLRNPNLSTEERAQIIKSIESAQSKIGLEKKDGYTIQEISSDQIFADKKTPSGNAMAIYKDGETPEIPITPGKLINDINPIEFPELVDLARELMGKVPQIVKKTGNAAGRFYGDPNNPRIKLVTELFDGKNPREMAKVLAHEIGHLIDFLPEGTLARGNMLGRLRTLQKFMKNTFGEAESVTNKEIKAELLKVTQELHPYNPEKVPASYKRYRESARELYAEAISMLFNYPGRLQEMAPKFWDEFFKGLDQKPEVSKAFFELQDILGGDRDLILNRRREGIRGMFDKGDMKAADIHRAKVALREQKRKNYSLNFKFNVIDKNYPVIDRINAMKKRGENLSDDENPLFYLEERNYLGGKIKAFVEKNIQPIYAKLGENEISWTDFGEALFYDRIRAGDRSEQANPRGITPKAAEELLEKMFKEMGETRATILANSMVDFRDALKTVAEEAFTEGLYKSEMHDTMMENPAYATFQVLDHMEEGVTSKIYKSIGTLKDIANPADASILKTISTLRAIEQNKVKRSVVTWLEKSFPEDIKPAKTINTPKGPIPQESKMPDERLVTYMKDGKRIGYYVDPYIKASVENGNIGDTMALLRLFIQPLATLNSTLFRPLFITYNPGFQAFNLLRDFQRFWKNTPTMTIARAFKLYVKAMPAAKARAWGDITNATLQKMEEQQILSISYNQLADGAEIEDKQIETILRNSGLDTWKPEARNPLLQPFIKVLDFIKNTGDFIETLPKVAGYLEFTKGETVELSREQKSFIRKNIGSPDFLAGGFAKPLTNEVFLFSNAIAQGIRSDVNVATDPKTRSGYWWKTAKINMFPKVMMLLASLGFFGAAVKEIMDGASEYDKTNYTIIPLGFDENGKPVYFRLPQDETGRMIGGLVWKIFNSTNNNQNIGKDLIDMASFTGGQIPSVTPSITSVVATGQFISGQNPYDWFRNREVLTDDQMKAGGMYSAKPFLGWLFNQSGGGIFYHFTQGAPREQSGTEKLFNLPLVGNIAGRFIKVSNYGETEKLNKIRDEVQGEQARRRIDENNIINDYIGDAQKSPDDKAIEKLVAENKAALVNEVLGHVPETKEELARANNIVKKYQIGLQRGESDPVVNSLISAVTNEEKVELLTEIRASSTKQEYNALMLILLKYKIVSPEVFIKVPNPAKKQ